MSTLIAIAYPSEQKAEEVRGLLFDLSKRYLIKISSLTPPLPAPLAAVSAVC